MFLRGSGASLGRVRPSRCRVRGFAVSSAYPFGQVGLEGVSGGFRARGDGRDTSTEDVAFPLDIENQYASGLGGHGEDVLRPDPEHPSHAAPRARMDTSRSSPACSGHMQGATEGPTCLDGCLRLAQNLAHESRRRGRDDGSAAPTGIAPNPERGHAEIGRRCCRSCPDVEPPA